MGKRGIVASLLSFSVFTVPYLFLLSSIIKVKEVFSVGTAIALVTIIFLWIVAAVFKRIGKERKLAALGITLLLAIPFTVIVNAMLSNMIGEPVFDVWDMLSVLLLLILAFGCLICDYARKR